MHAAIASKREEIEELCRRYNVLKLEIYGSGARGTDFDPKTSDADFLVKFGPLNGRKSLRQYFGFEEDMKAALGREIDLISVDIDKIRNKYFRAAIKNDMEIIYDKTREQDLVCVP